MPRLATGPIAFVLIAPSFQAAPVPKDTPPTGVILFASGMGAPPRLFSPTGGPPRELSGIKGMTYFPSLSPDGKRLAFFVPETPPANPKADPFTRRHTYALHVVDIDGKEVVGEPVAGGFSHASVVWAADGKSFLINDFSKEVRMKSGGGSFVLPGDVTECELATRKTRVLEALRGLAVAEVAPDGKFVLAEKISIGADEKRETERIAFARDGWKKVPTADFPPDKRLRIVSRAVKPDATAAVSSEYEYLLVDPVAKTETAVKFPDLIRGTEAKVVVVRLSPDGRHLLFAWSERVPDPDDWPFKDFPCRGTRLTITTVTGADAKTIYRPEIKTRLEQANSHFAWIEWR